jgi:cell division septation protein DedD
MFLRLLFLLLLALNAGVAGWLLFGRHAAPLPPPTDPGVAELRLLSERPGSPAPRAAEAERAARSNATQASDRCLSIGPFTTQADTRNAVDALTPHVARIQFREQQATQSRGWWVFLPAFSSREDAVATARELSAKGVHDYYVVTAGDQQNMVSLGLFHDPDNARRRRDQLAALGFRPQLTERTETLPEYRVDVALPSAPGFDWRTYVRGTGIDAQPIDCF